MTRVARSAQHSADQDVQSGQYRRARRERNPEHLFRLGKAGLEAAGIVGELWSGQDHFIACNWKTSDKKQAIKTSDKKQAKKTMENIEKIKHYLEQNGESKTSDIAEYIGLSSARTRALLSDMKEIEAIGGNSNRTYKLK